MQRVNGSKGALSPFIAGLTQILDIRANFSHHRYAEAGWETDAAAFRADWVAIRRDMRAALGELGQTEETAHCSEA